MEKIEVIREQIKEIERKENREYLKKCEWGPPIRGNTVKQQDEAALRHYEKAVECYLRHNAWVDDYNNRKPK